MHGPRETHIPPKPTQPHVAIAHNWKRIPPVNKPIPISERGMRLHVVDDSSALVRRRHLARADVRQLRCHAAYWSVQVFQVLHRGVAPRQIPAML
jgi:hypothetical protein